MRSQRTYLLFLFLDPTSPRNISVSSKSSTSLYVEWLPPKEKNGKILNYVIYYQRVEGNEKYSLVAMAFERNKTIPNLLPYTNYSIEMAANTSAGYGRRSNLSYQLTQEAGALSLLEIFTQLIYGFDKRRRCKFDTLEF